MLPDKSRGYFQRLEPHKKKTTVCHCFTNMVKSLWFIVGQRLCAVSNRFLGACLNGLYTIY